MAWLKYRHKFANGNDPEWTWKDIGEDLVDDEIDNLHREYDYSEHYRGVDYEVEPLPPASVLEVAISQAENSSKYWATRAQGLRNILEGLPRG